MVCYDVQDSTSADADLAVQMFRLARLLINTLNRLGCQCIPTGKVDNAVPVKNSVAHACMHT